MSETFAIVLAAVALLAVVTYAPPLLLRHRAVRRLRERSRGRLVLTYDDGPYGQQSLHDALLETLARHDVTATFFVVGFRVAARPEACERLARAGHEVGWHTYWHRDPLRRPFRAFWDVLAGRSVVAPWANARLFRPVRGRMTTWSWLACALRRDRIVYWTLDSGDSWAERPAPESVWEALREAGGGVVLLHDHHGGRKPECSRFVLELTESLIRSARKEGWQICPASSVLGPA